jgi:type IV pilus assembly protein PilN
MKLTINLATRRYVNLRRLNAGLLLGFLVLGTLLVFKVSEVAKNQAELGRIKNLAATAGNPPGAKVSAAELQALAVRISFANELIQKKTVSWLTLLDRLEEVVPEGVALTEILPDPRTPQQLKLSGVARSFANLRSFLERMEQSQAFSEVYLMSQSDTKVGLTQQGLTFSVACKVEYR